MEDQAGDTGVSHQLDGISPTGGGCVAYCSCGRSYFSPHESGGQTWLVDFEWDAIHQVTAASARAKWEAHVAEEVSF